MSFMRLLWAIFAAVTGASAHAAEEFDTIIRNARVLDGSGTPWFYADVALKDGRIAAMGRIDASRTATDVIDANGLYLAPGFIDAHSHAWSAIGAEKTAGATSLLTQGVTTVFINPDGFGPVDLAEQRGKIEAAHPGVNVAQLIGHNSVREAVMGFKSADPTAEQLERMKDLVRRGMQAGAFGLSAGPFYSPGNFSKTPEHVALAEVAAGFDGFYTSHIRDESRYSIGLVAAVDEVIQIAREAHLPGIVSHIKASTPACWGLSGEVIAHVSAARLAGVEVFADQYPYDASATSLGSLLLPPDAQEGGDAQLLKRLSSPRTLAPIRKAVAANLERRGGPGLLQVTGYEKDRSFEGKRLDAIAQSLGIDPVDAAIQIIRGGDAAVISYTMSEADIRAFMAQPWTMTSTDGDLPETDSERVHPRAYGTFPRKLRRYALDEHLITLENAVHSMTGLTATVLRMPDRGAVRVGAWADLVLFDPATVRDVATYENARQLSQGIRFVFVNGGVALRDGVVTGKRTGRVLSRAAKN